MTCGAYTRSQPQPIAASKRCDFDHWGRGYVWKRVVEKHALAESVSHHLYRADGGAAIAHIVPETRTPAQAERDRDVHNWVPPCTMWISDLKVIEAQADLAEYVALALAVTIAC